MQLIENNKMKADATQIAEALRKEAKDNKVFNDVCHMFASRERARQQVTIASLRLRMMQEGFNHDKKEYKKVLKFLAQLGFGQLEYDQNKDIIALKQVNTTLQSIGNAALQAGGKLERFVPQFDFQKLNPEVSHPPVKAKQAAEEVQPKRPVTKGITITLTADIEGKKVLFNIPKNFNPEEFAEVLADMYSFRTNS